MSSFIAIFLVNCTQNVNVNNNTNILDSNLIGVFEKSSETILTLNSDSTFVHEESMYRDWPSKTEPELWGTRIQGSFSVDSNQLLLTPKFIYKFQQYGDSLAITDSIKYYDSDSTSIKKNYQYLFWSENVYLLSEEPSFIFGYRLDNDFVRFADNYNSGSEPRWVQSYFAKRKNKVATEKIDKSQIPTKYQELFLDSPISIIVSDIEKDFLYDSMFQTNIYRYTLKGGTKNGVNEGMTFYGKEGCCIIKIMEVDELSCKGIIELCPFQQDGCNIGDTLLTRNERDYGKFIPIK